MIFTGLMKIAAEKSEIRVVLKHSLNMLFIIA